MRAVHRRPVEEIIFVHPSLLGGGAERVAIALANYFILHGFKFTFFLTKNKGVSYEIPDGVKVIDENAGPTVNPVEQILLIRQYIKKHPEAAIISFLPHQNMYTLLAAVGLPNRVVISIRNDPRFDFPKRSFLFLVRNLLYRRASAIVYQTIDQQTLMPKVLQKRGSIILNPLSDNIPLPYEGLRQKTVITSGRLEEQKNHGMTIRAFALFHQKHPDYELLIYGEGSLKNELLRLAEELGVKESVHFYGFRPDAVNQVRKASIFVMSSKYEGLSNSMLEALCMGVPTICTRCMGGGAEAVIEDTVNGLLVDIDDIVEETRLMNLLATDGDLASRLSHEARKLREIVGVETIGREWEKLICVD